MDESLNKVAVKVQPRSGFDKSFMSMGSGTTGTIYPIFVDEVIPNTKVNLKLALSASLPPLATDMYMRTSVKCEAFFVPMRLLFGSFEEWFTEQPLTPSGQNTTDGYVPTLYISNSNNQDPWSAYEPYLGYGTLADYLGFRPGRPSAMTGVFPDYKINLLPFVAYHKIYDDWYRNSLIQLPCFVRTISAANHFSVLDMPYTYQHSGNYMFTAQEAADLSDQYLTMNDTVSILSLRQRNFGDDYFTVATPSPQIGPATTVGGTVSGSSSSFTIAALRAGNSLQQFQEFNQLAGTRLVDQVRVRYNANLSDGVAQRAILLGTADFEVYSKGVYQNSDNSVSSSRNPYNSVASRYGSAYGSGQEFIIDGFTANEPGYIFVNATLVPRVTYGQGVSRIISRYTAGAGTLMDMPSPILQNVGNSPLHAFPLTGGTDFSSAHNGWNMFGYVQRFSSFMYRNDECHGALRKGGYLDSFALRRDFSAEDNVQISSNFLRIPKDYLDSAFAVAPQLNDPRFWFDAYFDYKVSQPLAKFSIPSLQNPAYEHGETVVLRRGGISL